MYLAYLYDNIKNINLESNIKIETPHVMPDLINVISKIISEGKSVQVVSKNERFLDYLNNYFSILDLDAIISYKEEELGKFN